jgi:hypothetical protein
MCLYFFTPFNFRVRFQTLIAVCECHKLTPSGLVYDHRHLEKSAVLIRQSGRWMAQLPSKKHWYQSTKLHGLTPDNIAIFSPTGVHKHCLRTDRLWGLPSLIYSLCTWNITKDKGGRIFKLTTLPINFEI